jgi:hypothetical protein
MVNKRSKKTGKRVRGKRTKSTKVRPPRQRGTQTLAKTQSLLSKSSVHATNTRNICSLVDPFCTSSLGFLYPDGSGGFSAPYQSKYFITLATNSNGNAALLFDLGQPSQHYATASGIDAGTLNVTWGTIYGDPNYSFFNSNYIAYRVVSAGIKVLTTESYLNASGTLLVGFSPTTYQSGTYNCSNLSNYISAEMLAVRDCKVTMIAKAIDKVVAREFAPLSYTADTDPSFFNIFLGITGGVASTTIMSIEVRVNYEFKPNVGNANNNMAMMSKPDSPNLVRAANLLNTELPPVIQGNASSLVESLATKLGTKMMSAASTMASDLMEF